MPSVFGRWPRVFEGNGNRALDWAPSVDISETDTEYLIRAELPAVKKEDVHITLDDSTLTISGERKQKTEEKKEKMHRVETVYGKFSRSFTLPDNADAASIRAESKDGVITVHVTKIKVEAKKPTEIKVQ
jgi:HSP20 family protein